MGTINAWERFYKSNFEISKDKSAVDIDSIAYVVQEYLFSSKASFDIFDCDMSDRIMFYDFMSLAKYFVNSLGSDFYEATLKGYINNLRQQKNGFQSYDTIEYTKDNNAIIVYNASSELVVSLLWTTYLYCLTRYRIKNTQTWLDKSNKIYDLMRENYPYVEPAFKERSPVKYTEEAVKMLVERINSKKEKENQTAETSKEKNDDIEKLKARIAELEEKCKQQEEQLNEHEEPVELLTPHDKVRLDILLGLMENNGANLNKHGNKTKAAQLMKAITGLPFQTCKNYCSDRNVNTKLHEEEVLKINTLVQALDMKIRL